MAKWIFVQMLLVAKSITSQVRKVAKHENDQSFARYSLATYRIWPLIHLATLRTNFVIIALGHCLHLVTYSLGHFLHLADISFLFKFLWRNLRTFSRFFITSYKKTSKKNFTRIQIKLFLTSLVFPFSRDGIKIRKYFIPVNYHSDCALDWIFDITNYYNNDFRNVSIK